ncbi:MAG: glycosyltransferase family 4 protein [Candidatus Zixiibacteriota bacterium]
MISEEMANIEGKRKLKILVLNWEDRKHPMAGGAEVHLHEVFGRMVDMGHEVTLLSCKVPGAPKEEILDGIKVVRRGSRAFFNFVLPFVWIRQFYRDKYDIVCIDVNKIPFFSPLLVKKPAVVIAHHFFGKSIFIEASWPVALYVYLTEKLFLKLYRKYTFVIGSPSTARELGELGIDNDKINIVNYCVDHGLYRRTGVPKAEKPLIGYLGRLKQYKSVDHLIDALPKIRKVVKDARLVIVGDGDYLPELKAKVDQMSLNGIVEFAGFVSAEKKVEILQKCWVVVNPSAKEGWGLTVVESNACGTPVVASDVPGLRDAVVDDITGLLFQYGNIDEIADKTIQVIEDDDLRNKLTREGLKWAASFDWKIAAKKTLDILYKEIEKHRNKKI